jgi:hypothetical protein
MTQDIRKVVELTINEGRLDEFKQVANECNKCYILEWYKDSQALLAHLDNIRDLYEPLFKVSHITRIEVFGNPSLKVRQAHLPGTKFFDYWAGIRREV